MIFGNIELQKSGILIVKEFLKWDGDPDYYARIEEDGKTFFGQPTF